MDFPRRQPLDAQPGAAADSTNTHPIESWKSARDFDSTSAAGNAEYGGGADDADAALSPLERDVLDEYAALVGNLDALSNTLSDLASRPSAEILDALRALERRTAAVFTLLKASVYSIVLQQEIYGDEEGSPQR